MKKIMCLFVLVFLSVLFVPNVVHAQSGDILPEQSLEYFPVAPTAMEYMEHYFEQELTNTIQYTVVYFLPYKITRTPSFNDYVLIFRYDYNFTKGRAPESNSYIRVQQEVTSDGTYVIFEVYLRKSLIQTFYPDNDVTPFFERDSVMYFELDGLDLYQRGFNAGVKSVTNKYTSYVLKWTLPFVTLVILSGIYIGYKKEWFHND